MVDQSPPRFARAAIILGALLVLAGVAVAIVMLNEASDVDPSKTSPSPTITGSSSPSREASAPVELEATFSFVALGDYGSRDAEEDAVANQIRRLSREVDLDAFVTTGDNVYPEGSPAYLVQAWDEPYGWLGRTGIEVYASLGNHDIAYEGGSAVIERLDMPGRWYSRRIGDAEIFILDSNLVADPRQKRWVDEALSRSDAAWKIVSFHHPPYSCSLHGNSQPVIDEWLPIFEEQGVDLVLNGHDHNYQRFEPQGEATFVVTGGGGYALYEIEECVPGTPEILESNDDVHHFLHVEGDRSRLVVRALTAEGDEIDNFRLMR